MTIIGYTGDMAEQQDLDKQRHLILENAHHQQLKSMISMKSIFHFAEHSAKDALQKSS
jgi:hypothetical protein